jgi:hypothetical protein
MDPKLNSYCRNSLREEIVLPSHQALLSKFTIKDGRKILKVFLLGQLHQLFCELFRNKIQDNKNNSLMECYTVDSKIIQFLISGIVETGEYTLEGIAYYTRIPFDVILDGACGNSNQFSITPWARIVDLYIQVNPEVTQVLFDKLLEIRHKNRAGVSLLLNES